MIGWKNFNKEPILNPVKYAKEIISRNIYENINIYIGCDSQNFRKKKYTGFVTVIAFHIGTSGIHCIYKPVKYKIIRNTFQRLWMEAMVTYELAEKLKKAGIYIYQVDLDFNKDKKFQSNQLVAMSEGMFKGIGYNVASKPDELVASRAADHILRTYNWKREKNILPIPKNN